MAFDGLCCLFGKHVRRTMCVVLVMFCAIYTVFFVIMLSSMSNLKNMPSELSSVLKRYLPSNVMDFTNFDNVSGVPDRIVPNVVHYVKFRSQELSFVEFLSIRSAQLNHRPERIIVHCNVCRNGSLVGKYWDMLQGQEPKVEVRPYKEPTHIFGKRLSSVYHASDIARILILMEHGGIFLDSDVIVVRSLDPFLHYEFVIGWPLDANIGTQVLIGHKDARFPKLWLNSYRWYRPFMWYYNAGQLPTESILMQRPGLVHRVPLLFGVHYLINQLYKKTWPEWKEYYTLHLLLRHRSYLDKESPIKEFNEDNVKNYSFTFGEIARSILYRTMDLVLD